MAERARTTFMNLSYPITDEEAVAPRPQPAINPGRGVTLEYVTPVLRCLGVENKPRLIRPLFPRERLFCAWRSASCNQCHWNTARSPQSVLPFLPAPMCLTTTALSSGNRPSSPFGGRFSFAPNDCSGGLVHFSRHLESSVARAGACIDVRTGSRMWGIGSFHS
jgi:hypothetical protein